MTEQTPQNNDELTINVFGLVPDSIVDGQGLRYAVFVQGCTHHCPGCHNPESQPKEGGTEYTVQQVLDDILSNKLITGVTLSGGEPFEQPVACAAIAKALKAEGKNVWSYSGYLFEDLLAHSKEEGEEAAGVRDLLNNLDVLVDGPFIEDKKSLDLDWRGSSNQRLIDVPATLRTGEVVLWEPLKISYELPTDW